ncbi:MAG: penicillin-binding transpeptidase domain-containing protein, partial [Pseudobdellovibrionaceae bacterium]
MLKKILIGIKVLALVTGFVLVGFHLWQNGSPVIFRSQAANAQSLLERQELAKIFGHYFKSSEFPQELEIDWKGERKLAQVEYTFDPDLTVEAQNLLQKFKPDYGALVALEPETGKILALASYTVDKEMSENLVFRDTFPAASVFKIVTAAAAIDKHAISPDHEISFNGSFYTLYKRNVLSAAVNRWSHRLTLREAFGKSVNTAFGRLGLQYLDLEDLKDYSSRFLFNSEMITDMPVRGGIAEFPLEKGYEMAEVVSGFNRTTRMSPIQGGVIAGTIANFGILRQPYLIQSLKTVQGEVLYEAQVSEGQQVVSMQSAAKLKELMQETVTHGTSKKSFRELVRSKKFSEIEVGGKTGSLMGFEPKGKNDWFVGYGIHNGR